MSGFACCSFCGEPRHHDLCRPHLQSLYADERAEHDEDRRKMVRLEIEVADLKQQLQEQGLDEHHR